MDLRTIKTKRLVLRKFQGKDVPYIFDLLSDIDVNKYLPWFSLKTYEEAYDFYIKNIKTKYINNSSYFYAICLKDDNIPIGYIKFDKDESHDLGYAIQKDFWSKGLISEAAKAILKFAKEQGLEYVTATHDINNIRSGYVMKSCGMKYCYIYEENWQPKDIKVHFRMYQINFYKRNNKIYMKYWNKYTNHFIEDDVD